MVQSLQPLPVDVDDEWCNSVMTTNDAVELVYLDLGNQLHFPLLPTPFSDGIRLKLAFGGSAIFC